MSECERLWKYITLTFQHVSTTSQWKTVQFHVGWDLVSHWSLSGRLGSQIRSLASLAEQRRRQATPAFEGLQRLICFGALLFGTVWLQELSTEFQIKIIRDQDEVILLGWTHQVAPNSRPVKRLILKPHKWTLSVKELRIIQKLEQGRLTASQAS